MTSRQIAESRGISIDAVKYHVANALAKIGETDERPSETRFDRSDRENRAGHQAIRRMVQRGAGAAASIHFRQARIFRLQRDKADAEPGFRRSAGIHSLFAHRKYLGFL